jgi:hypothetical protein
MDDEFPLSVTVDQAWTVHLSAHKDVNVADSRRCSLERYLRGKWQAGESDPDELTCYGLFLSSSPKVRELVRAA